MHLDCIARLHRYGLTGLGVIDAYYRRRIAPLMARPLRLYEMEPGDSGDQAQRCRISESFLSEAEVRGRFDEIPGRANFVPSPITGQPHMRPSPLAVAFV